MSDQPLAAADLHIVPVLHAPEALDLPPTYGEMVAAIQCDQVGQQVFVEACLHFSNVKLRLQQAETIPSFGKCIESIVTQALTIYDDQTHQYTSPTVAMKRSVLVEKMSMVAAELLRLQLCLLMNAELDGFSNLLAAIVAAKYPLPQFTHKSSELKQIVLASFEESAKECNVLAMPLDQSIYAIDRKIKSFSTTLQDAITNASKARFHAVAREATIDFERILSAWLNGYIESGGSPLKRSLARLPLYTYTMSEDALYVPVTFGLEGTWNAIAAQVDTVRRSYVATLLDAATDLNLASCKEIKQELSMAERKGCKHSLIRSLKAITSNIVSHMERRFISVFHYDKQHIPRTWSTTDDVYAEYINALREAERLLDHVSVLRLDPNVRGATWLIPHTNSTATIKTDPADIPDKYAIMSLAEVEQAMVSFKEKAKGHYTQALAVQKKATRRNYTPLIFGCVLLILAWYLLTNPLLLICVLITGGFVTWRFSLFPTLILNGVALISSIRKEVQPADPKPE